MKKIKKSSSICFVSILALFICFGFIGCKKKKTYAELTNEVISIKNSMRKKANNAYVYKVTDEILKRNFSQIDTIVINKKLVSIGDKGDINKDTGTLPSFDVDINSEGKVIGTINGVKDEYSFDIHTEIAREFMESAFSSDYSLTVKDQNGYLAASVSRGSKKDIKKMNDIRKEDAQYDVSVDGIKVHYFSKDDYPEGAYLKYYSEKKLSDNQIRKVGKTIKIKYFLVKFSTKDDSDYAYYLFDEDIIKHRNPNNRHLYY